MKQSASHDSPNPLRRYLKETRFSLFHVQCTFISAFLLLACTWQRGLWSSKEICWILLRTKCSTQDLIAISCPLGSYWTVGSSCSQRGPVFGLLLPSHISSCSPKSTWLPLTLLCSKSSKTTGLHLLRRISSRRESTPPVLYSWNSAKERRIKPGFSSLLTFLFLCCYLSFLCSISPSLGFMHYLFFFLFCLGHSCIESCLN